MTDNILTQKIEQFNGVDWGDFDISQLSAITYDIDLSMLEINKMVADLTQSATPYEQLVSQIFGNGHVFTSPLNIQVPETFQKEHVSQSVSNFIKSIDSEILEAISDTDVLNTSDLDYVGFTTVVNNKKVINTAKVKAYIELVEIMREIDDIITEENSAQLIDVMIYKAHEMCSM